MKAIELSNTPFSSFLIFIFYMPIFVCVLHSFQKALNYIKSPTHPKWRMFTNFQAPLNLKTDKISFLSSFIEMIGFFFKTYTMFYSLGAVANNFYTYIILEILLIVAIAVVLFSRFRYLFYFKMGEHLSDLIYSILLCLSENKVQIPNYILNLSFVGCSLTKLCSSFFMMGYTLIQNRIYEKRTKVVLMSKLNKDTKSDDRVVQSESNRPFLRKKKK